MVSSPLTQKQGNDSGAKTVSHKRAGTTGKPRAKKKRIWTQPYTHHTNELKWIIDKNVRWKTIKLLKDSLSEREMTLGLVMTF